MTGGKRLALLAALLATRTASAEEGVCKIVDLEFQPQEIASTVAFKSPSQIVAWIEDTAGNYVETVFITAQTGTFGLGNRPGRFDFNSGPRWPYGRRITVFPVWAHRHGLQFDQVEFQNNDESNLSHPFNESSRENRFCRPLMPSESLWDAGTCASAVFTDKGLLSPANKSLYPPRNDVARTTPDDPSVEMFSTLNPFDAVSQPTPPNGAPAEITYFAPDTVPDGDYVMFVEVSREFDHNTTYSEAARPSPTGIPWTEYGAAYRGQPSVIYKVPFTLTKAMRTTATVLDYFGYGDPDGLDGNIRPPDGTITTGVAGSGAERFAILSDGATQYRVRVQAFTEVDPTKPGAPDKLAVADVSTTSAMLSFVAPGDDGFTGKVAKYEVRYVEGSNFDEASFETGAELRPDITIGEGGETVAFPVKGLLNGTEYTIGIRAYDDCLNKGPVSFVTFTTPERLTGEVDWCFVATAAYGSTMANDVEMLRRFRDVFLEKTVLGELAVEAYYTFGPAVAGVVGESELLRATARAVLQPIVQIVKVMRF